MTATSTSTTISREGSLWILAPDVAVLPQPIVNVIFIGQPGAGDRQWVLVDAGLPGFTRQIASAAEDRFGPDSRPAAIVLTHAHFDHVGALTELAERWDTPIYATPLETPYIMGKASYPPPDPTVGGGGMSWLSFLYPRGPVDVSDRVHLLDGGTELPALAGWTFIETPGHSPGHVALYRPADRLLIAGDAFVTTDQESTVAAMMKPVKVQGPPMYFTHDWQAARHSVALLRELDPEIAITGHGKPLAGAELRTALDRLDREFDQLAMPARGRYVDTPVTFNELGPITVPDSQMPSVQPLVVGAAALGLVAFGLMRRNDTHGG